MGAGKTKVIKLGGNSSLTEIAGIGLNRAVYINGKLLEGLTTGFSTTSGYDWGYDGEAVDKLATAIITWYVQRSPYNGYKEKDEMIKRLSVDFKIEILCNMPRQNFEMRMDMDKWFRAHLAGELFMTPTELQIKAIDTYVPLLVCFNLMGFKIGVLSKITAEYKYLKKLKAEKWEDYKFYLERETKRYDVFLKKDIWMKVTFDNLQDVYIISGGTGEGEYYGHVIDELGIRPVQHKR